MLQEYFVCRYECDLHYELGEFVEASMERDRLEIIIAEMRKRRIYDKVQLTKQYMYAGEELW